MQVGSGGVGAVSLGLGELLIVLVVVLLVGIGVFKLAKLLWALFGQ
jgi:hypothetical protein